MDHLPFWHFPPDAAGKGLGQGTGDIIEYIGTLKPSTFVRPFGWMVTIYVSFTITSSTQLSDIFPRALFLLKRTHLSLITISSSYSPGSRLFGDAVLADAQFCRLAHRVYVLEPLERPADRRHGHAQLEYVYYLFFLRCSNVSLFVWTRILLVWLFF